jgi:FkbM family methyltransferase
MHAPVRVPLLFRLSRALERRRWRGGTAAERVCRRLGLLDRTVRYDLGRGISVDVPLDARPMDAADVRDYESALVRHLARAIDGLDGPVRLYDCGADLGLISLKLVARCPTIVRVVAIEPNAVMYPTLAANLARLPCRADAVLAAVGDATGRGELQYPGHDPGSDVSRYVSPIEAGSVAITTIDALAPDDDGCIALKCDVEGSELAVLRGAHETLRHARRFVVAFEAHPLHVDRTGIDPVSIVRELRRLRPCTAIVAETGVELHDDVTPLFQQLGTRRIVNIVCTSVGAPPAAT